MTSAAVVPSSEPPLSQIERVVDTFVAPTKTFRDINRSTSWWLPFLVMVIISVAFVAVVDKKIGFEKVNENQIKMNPKQYDRLEQLPPDQRERQMQMGAKITGYISYCFPVIQLLILLIMALVLWGSYSFGAGAQVTFGKSLAVVVYSNMVGMVKPLLAVISILAGASSDTFTFQNPVATNLGFLVDPIQHKVLYALGTSIDIVNFWILFLVAIGFTCITKVKSGTSYAIVFGWWVVLTLIGVGMAAAF
jgi:Yip1-like protein